MGCGNSKLGPEAVTVLKNEEQSIRITSVLNLEATKQTQQQENEDESIEEKAKPRASRKYLCQTNNVYFTNDKYKIRIHKLKYDSRITNKYVVKAVIGKGTYSRVLRVENRLTKQPFAIKMLDRQEGWETFDTELSILRRVKHPYVIQLIEVLESNDKISMVMELATGGDLFDRIVSKGNFSERDATRVLYMVLDGIQYLHSLGITHRDLKPDNLLYYHSGHDSKILITDFGLASTRRSGGDMLMNTACGTPEYIAPEIVARKPYTCSVDMWAIGVIAFILLSGTFPFEDENHTRLYKLILKAKYSYEGENWTNTSELAQDFIDHLLVVDPSHRMTATEALMHPWINSRSSSSGNANLHKSGNQNELKASASKTTSVESSLSKNKPSLRSGRRRVCLQDLQKIQQYLKESSGQ